jgi:hypothetical protein
MFPETYGFSANFTVAFWIEEVRYKNPLIKLALTSVEEAFDHLGWRYRSSLEMKLLIGSAEPIKESKLSTFFRLKVNPILAPGMLSTMRTLDDHIHWEFAESEARVTAIVDFYIRKTTFFNRREKERLSSVIRRLFEEVLRRANKYSLGVSFNRTDRSA